MKRSELIQHLMSLAPESEDPVILMDGVGEGDVPMVTEEPDREFNYYNVYEHDCWAEETRDEGTAIVINIG